MYLYLGQDAVIHGENLIGIFDLENTTVSKHTRKFLNRAQKENVVQSVTTDIPKAFVVCSKSRKTKGTEQVYITQMAPSTLTKRFNKYATKDSTYEE